MRSTNRIFKTITLTFLLFLSFNIILNATQQIPDSLIVSNNGKFIFHHGQNDRQASSQNGRFWCRYDVTAVGDEIRILKNFELYENDKILFRLADIPGSDVSVSNSGLVAFMDLTHHFRNELKIHFYASHGEPVLTKTFNGGSLFGFSQSGNKFAVGTGKNFFVISVQDKQVETFPAADQFDFSENEKLLALARGGAIRVYGDGELLHVFNTGFIYPRKVRISTTNQFVAVIDKLHLKVFSLKTKQLLFEKKLTGKKSFRDLFISKGKILAGVQHREKGVSTGIIKMYDLRGKLIETKQGKRKKFKTFPSLKKTPKSSGTYEIIPWMFFPFDSMRTVWNYYEQHMGYGAPEDSYLHQGLDLIVPINEPVYAVTGGIVKCVLSLTGGAAYWRIATSDTQTAGYSQGWLYAHLIQSTIQFDVGDTVHIHDYLGNIIQWDQDWGHIHFVMIEDSGLVWRYDDNEWGIVYNPLLSLRPYEDLTPPIFFDVFENQKTKSIITSDCPAIVNYISHFFNDTLYSFLTEGRRIAVVVDEYGGTAGVITRGDILEEVVGEMDEHAAAPIFEPLGRNRWIVEGSVSLEDVNQRLGVNLDAEGADRLAGWFSAHAGHIPRAGETLEVQGIRAAVLRMRRHRIATILLEKVGTQAPEGTTP